MKNVSSYSPKKAFYQSNEQQHKPGLKLLTFPNNILCNFTLD